MCSQRVANAVIRRLRKVRDIGLLQSARILVDVSALRILRNIYGFHPWHVVSPLSARPYRRTVADLVNGLRPMKVVEVGCGLGSILSLVHAPNRFGYDIDEGAIAAARLLRGKKIHFFKGDASSVTQEHIDVLILVNWIHDFSPERLNAWLTPLLSRTRFLLLDSVDREGPGGYLYQHTFDFLAGRARCISERRVPGEPRRFLIYEVLP